MRNMLRYKYILKKRRYFENTDEKNTYTGTVYSKTSKFWSSQDSLLSILYPVILDLLSLLLIKLHRGCCFIPLQDSKKQ